MRVFALKSRKKYLLTHAHIQREHMCVCMCVCVCLCTYAYVYVFVCVCTHVCESAYIYTCASLFCAAADSRSASTDKTVVAIARFSSAKMFQSTNRINQWQTVRIDSTRLDLARFGLVHLGSAAARARPYSQKTRNLPPASEMGRGRAEARVTGKVSFEKCDVLIFSARGAGICGCDMLQAASALARISKVSQRI